MSPQVRQSLSEGQLVRSVTSPVVLSSAGHVAVLHSLLVLLAAASLKVFLAGEVTDAHFSAHVDHVFQDLLVGLGPEELLPPRGINVWVRASGPPPSQLGLLVEVAVCEVIDGSISVRCLRRFPVAC